MNYVTQDQSCIKEFQGLGTKRLVKMNTHESKFVLLKDMPHEEWIEIVTSFQMYIYSQHDLKSFNESDSTLFKIFTYDKHFNSAFTYIQTDYLKEQFRLKFDVEYKSYREILENIQKKSLEEQYLLWQMIKPTTHAEYLNAMRTRYLDSVNTLDITNMSKELKFKEGVEYLVSLLGGAPSSRRNKKFSSKLSADKFILGEGYKQRALQLLVYLQQSNLLLFSIGTYIRLKQEISERYRKSTNTGLITTAILNTPNGNEAVKGLLKSALNYETVEDDRDSSILSAWFLMSTTIEDIGDLSTEIIEESTEYKTRHYKWFQAFINNFQNDERYKHITFPSPRRISKNTKGKYAKARSLDWAKRDFPHLNSWVNLFEKFNGKQYVTYATTINVNAAYILTYLSKLEIPPEPNDLVGNVHIRNVELNNKHFTFRDFIDAWVINTGPSKGNSLDNSTKIGVMRYWLNVMQDLCEENIKLLAKSRQNSKNLITVNPISEIDCKWKVNKKTQTSRNAIRQDHIEIAKDILLSRDENGKPTFAWAMNNPASKFDYVIFPEHSEIDWKWKKNENGQVKYWQPSRAILLYLMLVIPLRSHQARWLDSGIADEFYWEDGKYIRNKRKFATKGRKLGVIQPLEKNYLIEEDLPGIYITTNKTQIWNPEDFKGYTIPWSENEVYEILEIQRNWIDLVSRYFHTTSVALDDVSLDIQPKIVELLPKFFPLFRDLSSAKGNNLPVSKSKLYKLWVNLCRQVETHLEAKNVYIKFTKPSTLNSDKEFLPIFDLHSLRVSGVTNLNLQGVPFHIISKFIVGHASIAMTMHYEKMSPIELRKTLATYLSKSKSTLSSDSFKDVLDLLDGNSDLSPHNVKELVGEDWFNRFLISNKESTESAINAVMAANGQLTINVDGICPGAKCSEGDHNGGPVKGGPNSCGNCRFFVTGTAFLYGQAHKCNLLMYQIKSYSDELLIHKKKLREYEIGHTGYEQSFSRICEIENRLEGMVSDWWGRYQLLQLSLKSLEQASTSATSTSKVAQINPEFKIITSKTNKISLLSELVLSTELLEVDTENKGPQLELKEVLNVILSKYNITPFLVGLPSEHTLKITNLMAASMVMIFEENSKNNKTMAYEKMQAIIDGEHDQNSKDDQRTKYQLMELTKKFRAVHMRNDDGTFKISND